MTPHVQPESVGRFIAHIMRLAGEDKAGSQAGPKMALESRDGRPAWGFYSGWWEGLG